MRLTFKELVSSIFELIRLFSFFFSVLAILAARGCVKINSLDLLVDLFFFSLTSALCVRDEGLVLAHAGLDAPICD